MIFSFIELFRQINLLNWKELELDKHEDLTEEEYKNPHEDDLLRIFFLKSRNIKLNSEIFSLIYRNNIRTFFFFLKLRFNFFSNITFLLGHFQKNKFQWTNYNYIPYKMFTRLKPIFTSESIFKKLKNNKHQRLRKLITFKKKSGFLKKRFKLKNFLLLKLNSLKNFKFFNTHHFKKNVTILNQRFKSKIFYKNKPKYYNDVNKFIDLKKRWYKVFTTNRNLFKFFSNSKKTKQFQLTRLFSKSLKKTTKVSFLEKEFSLLNIIVRSKFVFTINEALFLIKNSFVFVNGFCVNDPQFLLKVSDTINIIFCKKYFFFWKTSFNQKLRLTYGVGYRLWRLNRFRNNFYKQSPTGIPDWIFKISFFYEDVPSYIEIDYLTLTLMIIKYPKNYYNYNFYFTKFLSFYLLRLYNWKYVI